MAKSPRNNDPREEREDSDRRSGTYVEVVGTPRRRKRGGNSSAPKESVQGQPPAGASSADAAAPKRESVRPAAIPAEQIRLPSGAVAYVSPALPRSSRTNADRSPPSSELHLDAPSWVDSGPTDRVFPPHVSAHGAPRAIREVIPRRIEDERVEIERASHVPASEARKSTIESVRPEATRPRASVEGAREARIPSESTRPRAVIDCIPDETTQARARLSAVQASLVLASQSERPPAMRPSSVPPPHQSGASVFDAKPQIVSDPPVKPRTSWGLVGLVAVLCSIISAAAVVAFKETREASPIVVGASGPRSLALVQGPATAKSEVQPRVTAPAPTVAPVPTVEQLPNVVLAAVPSDAPAAAEGAPSTMQAAAPSAPVDVAAAAVPTSQVNAAADKQVVSAPLAPAPLAAPRPSERRLAERASSEAPRALAQSASPQVEVLAMPAALNPGDTKAVLVNLAEQERATQVEDQRKLEEERKLPSTSRLSKAPSVRIEAARIAAALKKASQDAVARVNEEQGPAAPAPAKASDAKSEPAGAGNLPDNPF